MPTWGGLDQGFPQYGLASGISQFDCSVEFTETAEGLSGAIQYSTALYKPRTMERMAEHFIALCRAITVTPSARIRDLDYIGAAERRRLLVEYNDTGADYPREKCIHQLFAEQVRNDPGKTAVVFGEAELSYQELYDRSSDLALYLQSQGVKPDSLVGLCVERSLDMVVGILGILQAGGAYVPLDPGYPAERLAYMLQDSRAAMVLTEEKLEAKLGALVTADTRLVVMDRERAGIGERVAGLKAERVELQQQVQPHHLAYVIYTSGSTGQPKGVAIEHHSPVTLAYWADQVYSREESAGVLASTSICFDLSVYEILVTLSHGGKIILVPNALGLVDLPHKESVTLINTVPSAMEELVRLGAIPDSVQTINLAGEPLSPRLVDKIYDSSSVSKVYDLYGPSEDTTYSTYRLRKRDAPQSIGRPISNTQVYILDADNHVQPIGVPGELHIAGDGLARGYLHRAELTEEKFVGNPFQPGTRMYKTGDLARWLDDGNLEYLGRLDTQVKIRGFRIELGEIEARLNEHPKIQDSVVITQGQAADKRLIAFYRAQESTADQVVDLPEEELRGHLLRTLPEYMMPAAFVSLGAIPLSPNGKVDRRGLARMDVTMASGQQYVAPGNDTEKQLVEIWAEVLRLAPEKIGVNDSFFKLGGHSLLATQLISKVRSRLGIDVALKALFERNSVAQFAELIPQAEKSEIPPLRPVDRAQFERLPLSYAQERVWFINQLEPDNVAYNVPVAITVSGELEISQLEQAFNLIIARHENLRTLFPSHEGQAQQLILERLDFKLERVDLSHCASREEREREAKAICQSEAGTPFDLARGPLFRGKVIRLSRHEHIVMLNMHHIISDGWSLGVLIKELGQIMEAFRQGRRPELGALPIQYVDYTVWQRKWLEEGGVLKQQLAYWQEKLAGVAESLDLATDYPRPGVRSFAGATQEFVLDGELSRQLKSLAERRGGTLFMVLLAAFKVLLYRYTGQSDICVGSPIANRQYGETEGLIGMFVNTLALRSRVEGEDTFSALLSQVKATCLEAYEHQDTPFEKVVDMLQPERNLAISPLFQVMVILQNADMGGLDQGFPQYGLASGISQFDCSVEFTETAEGLSGAIQYSTALYKPRTMERMAEHFIALCRAITVTPSARIRDLDYIGAAERRRLLVEYNDTGADYPREKCIHQLFAEQVRNDPGKTAVVFGEAELSYQELYDRSSDLALYLQSQGVKPDSLVGLCVERSLDMVVGILGILQAGGAYVPLDPGYPAERLAYMLQDSRAAMVLTEEKLEAKLGALVTADTRLVVMDRERAGIGERVAGLKAEKVELQQQVQPHHLAYVIYTSGSTGQPKGVAIEHHSPVTLAYWADQVYSREESAGVLASTSICFDLSVYEILVTLSHGGKIILVPNALGLVDLPHKESVTLINTVPSAMEELVRLGAIPDSVQTINLAGEPLSPRLVDKIYDSSSVSKVYDLYGPSEDTTYSTYRLRKRDAPQSIGRPISNTQVYILDADNHVQPIGVPGELHIAGDGLARGYLHRAELTEEKFVGNPFQPGTRMYKTGDLARWLDDGNLEYLGRLDTQVKIRGFRIELGEIEARLNEHPKIQDSVVITQGQAADKRLIAFYRAQESTADQVVDLPEEELRGHLLRTLPEYMMPAAFVSLGAIPLSPNGKVDRRGLARMDVTMASGQQYVAPGNDTEKQLVEIWAEVLRLAPEKIGVNDSFFKLGGHSLLATQLISKVRSRLGIDLPMKALFESISVAQLAELIAELVGNADKNDNAPIRPVNRAQFERLPLSYAQERVWFFEQLEPGSARYNVPVAVTLSGELEISQLEQAFNLIIARHENLRTLFPSHEGQAQQLILERLDFKFDRVDLSHGASREERDREAKAICQSEAATPFDLAQGPLLRGKVIRLSRHEHIVMLNMHHIISDGWSLGVLIKELDLIMEAFRQGRRPELGALPIQYVDYTVWQRKWLEEGGVLKQQLAYWQEKLAGVAESLDLATDYPRPGVRSFAGATQEFVLDGELSRQLKSLAERRGGTLFMVLLAAFKVLLYRYTDQQDICVGTLIANRQYAGTEGLIGMFVNILALRSRVEGEDTFSALLSQVKATCLEAYEHQDTPFEKVVDMLQPERNLAISPLFQVMVILQNADMGGLDQGFPQLCWQAASASLICSVEFTETAEGLSRVDLNTAPRCTSRGPWSAWRSILSLCAGPSRSRRAPRIRDLDYIGAAERRRLLVEYNDTGADYPREKCIHQLFAEQVRNRSRQDGGGVWRSGVELPGALRQEQRSGFVSAIARCEAGQPGGVMRGKIAGHDGRDSGNSTSGCGVFATGSCLSGRPTGVYAAKQSGSVGAHPKAI
jgi:amino acid adenylation domain-containing protein